MAGLLDYVPNVGGLLAGPAPQTYGGLLGNVAEWWRSQPSILDQMRAIDAMRSRTGDPLADFRADANNPELRAAMLDMALNFNMVGNIKNVGSPFIPKTGTFAPNGAVEVKNVGSPFIPKTGTEALDAIERIAREYGFEPGQGSTAYTGSAYREFMKKEGRRYANVRVRASNHDEPVGRLLSGYGAHINARIGEPLDEAAIRAEFERWLKALSESK